jgi:hypothetical protein
MSISPSIDITPSILPRRSGAACPLDLVRRQVAALLPRSISLRADGVAALLPLECESQRRAAGSFLGLEEMLRRCVRGRGRARAVLSAQKFADGLRLVEALRFHHHFETPYLNMGPIVVDRRRPFASALPLRRFSAKESRSSVL